MHRSGEYHSIRVRLPGATGTAAAELAEDRLAAELWAAGTVGLESRVRNPELGASLSAEQDAEDNESDEEGGAGGAIVIAYFAAAEERDRARTLLRQSFPEAEILESDTLPAAGAADWLAAYRERARPLEIGARLIVDPGEPGSGSPRESSRDDRFLLRIPARQAFGTGSHESTRLAVEWMETLDLTGRSVLDVGCGTGLLSLAAGLWGAAPVVGLEIDPVAACAALENQHLNRIEFRLFAGTVASLAAGSGFDVAVVNVLPERIRPDLAAVVAALKPEGSAIFSGLLGEQVEEIGERLEAHGLTVAGERRSGEWAALLTRRGGSA